jgi:hypothetical protein
MEGLARARAGFHDEGAASLVRGLAAGGVELRDRAFYVAELAQAHYLARRYAEALAVLAELDEDQPGLVRLIRAAASARLENQSDEEIKRNRNSDIFVEDVGSARNSSGEPISISLLRDWSWRVSGGEPELRQSRGCREHRKAVGRDEHG